MPSTCHLPVEILLKIFNHIKEKSHLVQYRLVCKTWASAANMAMLRHIDATDADKVMKLYHYLAANPNLSLHVRYIDNLKYIKWKDPTFDEFLTVVMTPNLRAIEGRFNTHEMSILLNNVRRTQLESLKMERLPIAKVFNDTYASLLLHFKATLTSLYFDLCRRTTQLRALNLICSKLDQFHNLTDLTVRDMLKYLATVQELDSMLKGCTRLVNLTLIISQEKVKRRLNELQLKEWLSREVQEAASMKSIHIKYMPANAAIVSSNYSRHQNDLLQYLSFKYPNVEQMYIDDYGQIKAGISHSVFDNRINPRQLTHDKIQRGLWDLPLKLQNEHLQRQAKRPHKCLD
ncbi:hypothetical protein MBANPS3_003700 [Mucor bainieri]